MIIMTPNAKKQIDKIFVLQALIIILPCLKKIQCDYKRNEQTC